MCFQQKKNRVGALDNKKKEYNKKDKKTIFSFFSLYESSLFLELNVATTSTANTTTTTAQDKSLHRYGFHKSDQLFRETSFRS